MKNSSMTPEEKADYIIENFGGMQAVDPSADFDSKVFARFDSEFSARSKTPKWFWVAALAILSINVIAAYNYTGKTTTTSSTSSETKTTNTISSYYFQGGTDWYQQ
jgi:hypothetical protein